MAADTAVARLTEELLELLVRRAEPATPANPPARVDIKALAYDGNTDAELFLSQFEQSMASGQIRSDGYY